jgi:hypothetical protein
MLKSFLSFAVLIFVLVLLFFFVFESAAFQFFKDIPNIFSIGDIRIFFLKLN